MQLFSSNLIVWNKSILGEVIKFISKTNIQFITATLHHSQIILYNLAYLFFDIRIHRI